MNFLFIQITNSQFSNLEYSENDQDTLVPFHRLNFWYSKDLKLPVRNIAPTIYSQMKETHDALCMMSISLSFSPDFVYKTKVDKQLGYEHGHCLLYLALFENFQHYISEQSDPNKEFVNSLSNVIAIFCYPYDMYCLRLIA